VIEGRRTFANMLKYIKMTASSNFGNVFSVLVASAFLPFLPMLPLHLLIQNLLYDVSQVAIPFDNVDDEQIQSRSAGTLRSRALYALLWPDQLHFRHPDLLPDVVGVPGQRAGSQTLFQSGWFVEGLLSQTLIVHMIRTRRIPFIQSRAAWPLIDDAGGDAGGYRAAVLAAGKLSATAGAAAELLPVADCDPGGYMTLTQMVKGFYSRRYGWQ
jgi:Mg2+-importing ATPase